MIENDEISQFREKFIRMINSQDNPFHPLVFINETSKVGGCIELEDKITNGQEALKCR